MKKCGVPALASPAGLHVEEFCPARNFPPQWDWINLKIPKIRGDSRFDTPIFGSDATVAGLDFDLIKDSLAVILVGLQRW